MSSTARKFECGLRLRKEMHRKLVSNARKNGRSLNGEIEQRLEASFAIDQIRQALRDELLMLRREAADAKKA